LKMAPIDRSYTTLYSSAVVCQITRKRRKIDLYSYTGLSCVVFELFDVQIIVTLKSRLRITEGHWKWYHSVDRIRIPIRLPLYRFRTKTRQW